MVLGNGLRKQGYVDRGQGRWLRELQKLGYVADDDGGPREDTVTVALSGTRPERTG